MVKTIKVRCKNCKKTFYRLTGRFNEAIKFGWNQYCSTKCQFKHKTTKKEISCENCGRKFERTLSGISIHNYCSHSCAMIVNNKRYDRKRLLPKFKICEQCGKKYRKSTSNKKYCSLSCRVDAERYKPEELLDIIRKYFKKLKRVPARREILNGVNGACRKSFGSWNNAVLAAGFTPNRSHDNRMYKRSRAKALDGHLCDSISELLIDNWFYKNSILHERDAHYPETNHKSDWKIIIEDKEIFVEYFGLANDSPKYDRSIKEKEMLCKKHNIPLIGIYPKDIYPKNLLNKNLKEKFQNFINLKFQGE
ncbi:hypothetical protein KJ786_01065 [Patescibacteria group bacterium]|nr:hypothetical protein [Patescibacteria group bacterium]